jgi:hypothetical protein
LAGLTLFDWSGYLVLATTLSTATDEASQRSALSRAYYAVFNKARLYWLTKNVTFPDDGAAHFRVWAGFVPMGGKYRQAADCGKRLLALRRLADYQLEPIDNIGELLADALKDANRAWSIL